MKNITLIFILTMGLIVLGNFIYAGSSRTIAIPDTPTGQYLRDDFTWQTASGSGDITSVGTCLSGACDDFTLTYGIGAATGTFSGAITATGGFVGNADTATALASAPTDCGVGLFTKGIYVTGSSTCAAIIDSDVPDTITASNYLLLTGGTMGNSTTSQLYITGLSGCDTIDTETSGLLKCGTDATGAGGNDVRLILDALDTGEQHDVTASTALTEITALSQTLAAGTYTFKYSVIYQSNQATNGIRLAVNYSGTNGAFVWWWRWADLAATASTAVPDQDDVDAAGNVMGVFQSRAESILTRGVTLSVDTANAYMLAIIEGVFVATGDGDLELWHGSEVATAAYTTSVMIGTSVEIHKTK